MALPRITEGLHITSEDRWKEVLDKLKFGADRGVEKKRNMRTMKYVYFKGRRMSIKEASLLSGLSLSFFYDYIDKEIPVDAIVEQLDARWVRDKIKKMKLESFSK